jgi:hypothetical protein
MPASPTIYSSRFDTTTHVPVNGRPKRNPYGVTVDQAQLVIPTTSSDFAGELSYLLPVPRDCNPFQLLIDCGALSSATLDADIVLIDDAGTTILWNAGTAFTAAVASKLIQLYDVTVVSANDNAVIALLINTAGGTPSEGTITITAHWMSKSHAQ